jgi:hypothetical protein
MAVSHKKVSLGGRYPPRYDAAALSYLVASPIIRADIWVFAGIMGAST